MASAEVVIVPPAPIESERNVVLTLTMREAEALLGAAGRITGPNEGPRGSMNNIYYALQNAGLDVDKCYRNFEVL